VPGDEAFRPLDKGGCPLVKAANCSVVFPLAPLLRGEGWGEGPASPRTQTRG
jgi:hypothetical protein